MADFCVETRSTAEACLLAPKHFESFSCKANSGYFSTYKPSILKHYAQLVLIKEFGNTEPEDIRQVAKHG